MISCNDTNNNITVYETSESGNNLTELSEDLIMMNLCFLKSQLTRMLNFKKSQVFGGA